MNDIYVILPNIRSTYNVGSIFRTADSFGVKKIFLCGITPTPKHPKVAKTALGAENFVPWEYRKQALRLIKELKAKGVYILGLEKTRKSENILNSKPKFPMAIILGNEVLGIPLKYQKLCDLICHIEMRGKKESLNVATAFGIAGFYFSQNK